MNIYEDYKSYMNEHASLLKMNSLLKKKKKFLISVTVI